MRGSLHEGLALTLLVAAGGLALACGGRASTRAVTSAEPPPIADWGRPARLSEQPARAVRLDRPAACEDDCEEAEGTALPEDRLGEYGTHVSLRPGMTLYSLAHEYGVPLQSIIEANGIDDPRTIPAGTEIYIPARTEAADPGHTSLPKTRPSGGKTSRTISPTPHPPSGAPPAHMSLAWPLNGRITGNFGLRSRHHHHDGIDIDGTRGEEVRAVAAGIVVRSGSEGKYGRTVVIDHGDDLTTLYAHASRLLVKEGDRVDSGEVIAEVGATGNAHGTHLHFEVRRNGRPVDPLPYFKPEILGSAR